MYSQKLIWYFALRLATNLGQVIEVEHKTLARGRVPA